MEMKSRSRRPLSPCVNICTLDDEQTCMGCRRTLAEIRDWAHMSPGEQWAVVDRLAAVYREQPGLKLD